MHPTANTFTILLATLLLPAFHSGCRGPLHPGPLPPTEPPRVTDEAGPEARTDDGPVLGPLAGDGLVSASGGSGGTSILPPRPEPGPGPGGTSSGGTGNGGASTAR